MHAGRYDVVVEQARKLVNAHQFNTAPLRVLLAALASGFHATDGFLASTLSKHLLRELRSTDTALKNPEGLRWNGTLKRFSVGGAGKADAEAEEEGEGEGEEADDEGDADAAAGVQVYGGAQPMDEDMDDIFGGDEA